MHLLDRADQLLLAGFLVSTMTGLGLHTDGARLRAVFAARSALVRTLVANFVVAPLVAIAILRLIPLPPGPAAALLILACVPGGLSSLQFTRKLQSREASAAAMVVTLSALAVLVSPLLLRFLLPGASPPDVPYFRVLAFYALFVLAPLAAGMLLDERMPRLAEKLSPVLGLLSAVLFVAFMLATRSFRKEAVASVGGAAVGAMLLFILAMMAAGWLLGGPHRDGRQLLASTTSMRNAAFAMAIAHDSPAGAVVMPSLVAFSLLMIPPNTLLMLWGRLQARRAARGSKANEAANDR